MRLVLASASPSRRMILEQAGLHPVIKPAKVDEESIIASLHNAPPQDVVATLAQAKCEYISSPDDVVVGCDSMLLLENQLQGKPHTVENTISRWKQQRGKEAHLLTGHYVRFQEHSYEEVSSTTIRFASPSDEDIAAYAASGEPLECAGAFTLEALGGWFIDAIQGDPSSVIGLSLPVLRRALYSFGLQVNDFWNNGTHD